MLFVGILLLGLVATALSFALTAAATGRLSGAHVLELSFGFGPAARFRLGSMLVKVALFPVGSSVVFLDRQQVGEHFAALVDGGMSEDAAAVETRRWVNGRKLFNDLPLPSRIAIVVAGWLPILLAGVAVFGLASVGDYLGSTYGQIVPFLRAKSFASEAIASVLAFAESHGAGMAALVVALKITALNFLPLPMLTGGAILNEVFASATGRDALPAGVFTVGVVLGIGGIALALAQIVTVLVAGA